MPDYTKSYNAHIGTQLSELRKQQKFSQTKLAGQLGITRQQLSKYEKGIDSFKMPMLAKLAEMLRQPLDYFLPGAQPTDMLAAQDRTTYTAAAANLVDISGLSSAEQRAIKRKIAATKTKGKTDNKPNNKLKAKK